MTAQQPRTDIHDQDDGENPSTGPDPDSPTDDAGQVSEVSGLGPTERAGDPIFPSDAVAGAPDGESGEADEGAAGPNGIPPEQATKGRHSN
jgi:hypothetical protein